MGHNDCWIVNGTCLVMAAYIAARSAGKIQRIAPSSSSSEQPRESFLRTAETCGYVVASGVGIVLVLGIARAFLKDY